MLIKTNEFTQKLNSKLYQYTFNKSQPLSLKGSFHDIIYISDIDFTAYVHFNKEFIQLLIRKINNLKDFKFMYLNAGTSIKLPWSINPEWGCDFDLSRTKKWFSLVKSIPKSAYDDIEKILDKKKLLLGDLIDIEEIIRPYSTIKWSLSDIKKGNKTVDGKKYVLLDELKNEQKGSVLNSIYIDGTNIVSVDIGLVDKKYTHPIWNRLYKYYTQNWYKILKNYKKVISKYYEGEYRKAMKKFEYENALLAQTNLLKSLIKYKVVPQKTIDYISRDFGKQLEKLEIHTRSLDKIIKILETRLNIAAKPYVDYFFDKLTNVGKIKSYERMRLLEIAKIPTSDKLLIKRRKKHIKCPFFDSDINENINTIAVKLLLKEKDVHKCINNISRQMNLTSDMVVKNVFSKSPVSRLFLQEDNGKIYVRGAFINVDHIFLNKLGHKYYEYYRLDSKYKNRLQIYLITGI